MIIFRVLATCVAILSIVEFIYYWVNRYQLEFYILGIIFITWCASGILLCLNDILTIQKEYN